MGDADTVIFLNSTGPGSTPQEPLALVANMSNSERSALESKRRGGLASAVEPDTTIQYLYYLLYADDYEVPSKVPFDPEATSLGRIRVDSVAPPHSPISIKRCISRMEGNPVLAYADLFVDTSSDTPLREGHISVLHSDGPGLSPDEPMAIVQVKNPSIPDGKYFIKSRLGAKNIYLGAVRERYDPRYMVRLYCPTGEEDTKNHNYYHWDITNGNISMTSPFLQSSWAPWLGADMSRSTVPVPWRLIPADSKSYYLTTDMNTFSQNPRVPAVRESNFKLKRNINPSWSMTTLKKGDQRQMWEFIPI